MPSGGPGLAVVPARGGSKRIPRKNIREFHGRPLLHWTLDTLRSCPAVDRIVVSTDDEDVAEVARAGGAEVPFLRPAELADDHTGTSAVIAHAVEVLLPGADPATPVLCAYPAAVFVTSDDLVAARALLEDGVDHVVSATTFPAPVQRALRRRSDGTCEMVWPEHELTRSQDLEELWHDAGQFYWGTAQAWREQRPLFGPANRLHPLDRGAVQDIDTPEDWRRAEVLFRAVGRA